jgi:NAD(P)-dependent dehydrogenase (short-subunit alcohol dehydrogenase family)
MPASRVDAVLAVNLYGVVATARATIPAMLARHEPRQGRFIAVSSAAATRGLPLLSAYCAAKAGVSGLVRGLATELRGTGVTANAVSPGSTRTAILEESARLYGLASVDDFAAQQPVERLLEPEEVADLIVWLAGSSGSAVTGADLAIDGGLSV